MFTWIQPEKLQSLINIGIITLGTLAIIFVLRNVFKVAWKVIKFLLVLVGILVVIGVFAGWLQLSFI